MATRSTETAVREIVSTSLTSNQVRAFLLDANVWVTEELGSAGLSDARLEIIERWLACAFVRVRDVGLKSTSIKDVSESYQVDPDVTEYLTHAAAMDPTDRVRRAFLDVKGSQGFLLLARVGQGFKCDS